MFRTTHFVSVVALLICCSLFLGRADGHTEDPEYTKCMAKLSLLSSDNPIYFIVKSLCDALVTKTKLTATSEPEKPIEKDPSVIVARRNGLVVVTASDFQYNYCLSTIKNTSTAYAVDYDPTEGFVYFGDDGGISKAKLDGSERATITNIGFSIDGLAVDWVAKNLYWAFYNSSGIDHIGVSTADGKWKKTLIDSDIVDSPRGLALDPASGKMYWSEWGDNARIASAYLDGSNIQTLVDTNITWPNGIALDSDRGLIYWGDSKTKEIGVINVDGSERKSFLGPEDGSHMFGFSYLDDYLYWTDWRTNLVERINVNDTTEREVILESHSNQYGIKVTKQAIPDVTNECADGNGGCSQFCFYTPNGVQCGCADGWFLGGDGRTCEEETE